MRHSVFSPGDLVRVKMGDRGKPMRVPMFPYETGTPTVGIPTGSLCLVLEVREKTYDRTSTVLTILTHGQLLCTNGIYMESAQ